MHEPRDPPLEVVIAIYFFAPHLCRAIDRLVMSEHAKAHKETSTSVFVQTRRQVHHPSPGRQVYAAAVASYC